MVSHESGGLPANLVLRFCQLFQSSLALTKHGLASADADLPAALGSLAASYACACREASRREQAEDLRDLSAEAEIWSLLARLATCVSENPNCHIQKCTVVRKWLQECFARERPPFLLAALPHPPYRSDLRYSHRSAASSSNPARHCSDPDAISRLHRFIPQDVLREEALIFEALFGLLLCGEIENAIKYVCDCDRHWLAVLISASAPQNYETTQTSPTIDRRLWKKTCLNLSLQPDLSTYERATYSLLCGNTGGVLPVCKNFKMELFVYVNALHVKSFDDYDSGNRNGVPDSLPFTWNPADRNSDSDGPKNDFNGISSVEGLFNSLRQSKRHAKSFASTEYFSRALEYTLLNDFEGAIEFFTHGLDRKTKGFGPDSLRFAAHYIDLIQRLWLVQPSAERTDTIVKAYIQSLIKDEDESFLDAVPSYIAILSQPEKPAAYANYLYQLKPQSWIQQLENSHRFGVSTLPPGLELLALVLGSYTGERDNNNDDPNLVPSLVDVVQFLHRTVPLEFSELDAIKCFNSICRLLLEFFRFDELASVMSRFQLTELDGIREQQPNDYGFWEYNDYCTLVGFLELRPTPGCKLVDVEKFARAGLAIINARGWLYFDSSSFGQDDQEIIEKIRTTRRKVLPIIAKDIAMQSAESGLVDLSIEVTKSIAMHAVDVLFDGGMSREEVGEIAMRMARVQAARIVQMENQALATTR